MFIDLRLALTQLIKRPASSLMVIVIIAFGIGSTTAIFSVFHTILMQPLPVSEADGLVNLAAPGPKWGMSNCGPAGNCDVVFSHPMFRDLQSDQSAFEGIAAHVGVDANIATGAETVSGSALLVSGNYFDLLRLQPAAGRLLQVGDDPGTGESHVAVLSQAFWERHYGADPAVVGESLTINGHLMTIVGVAPAGFSGTTLGTRPEVFVPLTSAWMLRPDLMGRNDRRGYWLYLFARLRDDLDLPAATASVNALYAGILRDVEAPLNADMPSDMRERFLDRRIEVSPGALGQSFIRTEGFEPLALMLGTALLVLVICCTNVANLLLARGASRVGEIAIRASIGASRVHLVRQFMTETTAMTAVAALLSVPIAQATLSALVAIIPSDVMAGRIDFSIDAVALGFALALSVGTAMAVGIAPAICGARVSPGRLIKSRSVGGGDSVPLHRFRRMLATVQIGLSVVLLILAGLFALSLDKIARVELGIRTESLLSFGVAPGLSGYEPARNEQVFADIKAALEAEPGVAGVATSAIPLLSGSNVRRDLNVEGFENGPEVDSVVSLNRVGPGFFETLGMSLLAGRDISDQDREGRPQVAVVNEAFVRKFGLAGEPVGRRFSVGKTTDPDIEIVGVVADAKYSEIKDETPAQIFLPRLQLPSINRLTYYVSSTLAPDVVMARIRPIVASVDPDLPIYELKTMERVVQDNVFLDRVISFLSLGFATVATLLAAVGLYGVLAHYVQQRTREFGLRLALGATPRFLRWLIFGQIGRMAIVGIGAGLGTALLAGRAAQSLLFGVSAFEPVALAGAGLTIVAVIYLAALVPANRAAKVVPMEALRYE